DRFNKPQPLDSDLVGLKSFADEIGAQIQHGEVGTQLELVTRYPAECVHGLRALKSVSADSRIELAPFEVAANCDCRQLHDFVFVDAETTGLSAASGTVAFLVWVGYLDRDAFVVHQFFLPDYPDEPALLEAIADLVADRQVVASFNGKCF